MLMKLGDHYLRDLPGSRRGVSDSLGQPAHPRPSSLGPGMEDYIVESNHTNHLRAYFD